MCHTNTIELSGSNQIKNQTLQCKKLRNFQEQEILKIQQNNNKIYVIYLPNIHSQKSQISIKYLTLNHFQENLAFVSKIQTPTSLKTIQIQLSALDYQLVINNFQQIQKTFLDQVKIIWPDAKIPLYYNECNFIVLIPKVKNVALVDPFAVISFTMREADQKQRKNIQGFATDQNKQQLDSKFLVLSRCDDKLSAQFGYDNKIYLKRRDLKYFSRFKNSNQTQIFYCQVQPFIPFLASPSFDQYQQFNKLEEINKAPELKSILVELVELVEPYPLFVFEQNVLGQSINKPQIQQECHQINFQCSQICKSCLFLPEKILINQDSFNSLRVFQNLSFEMFIKMLQQKKFRIIIQSSNFKRVKSQSNELKNIFAKKFIDQILLDRKFVFLQNYYPFIMINRIYGVVLQKINESNKCFEKLNSFYLIRKIFYPEKQQQVYWVERTTRIVAQNIIVNELPSQKFRHWFHIIKKAEERESLQVAKENQEMFKKLFEFCYQKQLRQIIKYLIGSIKNKCFPVKVLFSTYSPNGKTYLHKYLSDLQMKCEQQVYGFRSWYLDCKTLMQQNNRMENIKNYLNVLISFCPYRILFFDNIEALVPRIQAGDQMRQKQKVISHIFGNLIDKILSVNRKLAIFTAKSEASIDLSLKFDKITKLKNPNLQTRTQIMNKFQFNFSKQWISQFVQKTQSLSLGSLSNYLNAKQIPIKKKQKKKYDFSMIIGLQQAKNTIKNIIQKPNKYGFIYEKVKIKVPRGILLYGATGNGKSALASALEDQFPMKFFTIKGSDILSKYIGGSQAAVREIFEKALSCSPSIVFFDEFQSIVPRRNSSGTGVTDRIVNQFLCYLDGVSSTSGVFIIAASSRPDLIDPALLRPGRIDNHIYLDYPNEGQRCELLKKFENSVKLEVSEKQFIGLTRHFSYSDLIGLLKELRIKKSSFILKEKENPSVQEFKNINRELFEETIQSYKIGTELEEQIKYKQLYERFKWGKGPQIKKQKFVQV